MSDGFRGVSKSELDLILKDSKKRPLSSTDLMPLDWEIIEYSLGDQADDMNEEEIEAWVQSTVPWYDGSRRSVTGGVNFTTDEDNAEGYGEYILVLEIAGPHSNIAYFSDSHVFARSPNDLKVIAYRHQSSDEYILVQ